MVELSDFDYQERTDDNTSIANQIKGSERLKICKDFEKLKRIGTMFAENEETENYDGYQSIYDQIKCLKKKDCSRKEEIAKGKDKEKRHKRKHKKQDVK